MPVLPKPYPDEVIGSVVARACVHTGLPLRRLLQSIFESKRSSFSFLLGDNVTKLANRCGLESRELLLNHTMFPYTVAYMAEKIQEQLTSKALILRPGEDSLSSLTKNVTHGVAYRRVCGKCIAEEMQQHGESYWHRKHMLPGVLVCLHHGEPLLETPLELRGRSHASNVILPHEVRDLRKPSSTLPWDLSARIAEVSANALEYKSPRSQEWLQCYREQAKTQGYTRPSGDVASSLVAHVLCDHFGKTYLTATGCPVADNLRNAWPALMVRPREGNNFSTPKHVLMQVFLENGPPKVENLPKVYLTPGKRTQDYAQMDGKTAVRVRARIQQLALSKERATIQALLLHVGAWAAFKHHRAKFTQTVALLENFKQSNQSERQIGGRPYWRKRLPSRYGATGVGANASDVHIRQKCGKKTSDCSVPAMELSSNA